MARRRYLSTEIGHDSRVNRVATEDDFAALLYTWMIPHCEDDAILHCGDPEEILYMVMPARRDKTPKDIALALALIHNQGLVCWDMANNAVLYPPEAFYKYQTQVPLHKRRVTHPVSPTLISASDAENAASPSPSPSLSKEGIGEGNGEGGTAPSETDWTPCLRKEERRKPIMEGITNALAPYARLLSSKEHAKVLDLLEAHCQFMYKRDWCRYPPECLKFFRVVCDKFKIAVEREQENGKPIRSVPALLETIYTEELGKWGDQFSRTAKSLA
jgi:hypothetical protein